MKAIKILTIALLLSLCLAACSKEDPAPTLTQRSYNMFAGNNLAISGENLKGVAFASDYEFVATASNGVIHSHYVGEATFRDNINNLGFKVTVTPKEKFLDSPYLDGFSDVKWGDHYDDVLRGHNYAYYEDTYYLGYRIAKDDFPSFIYRFDKNKKLDLCAVGVNIDKGLILVDYLAERYAPLAQISDYNYAFCHKNKAGNIDLIIYVAIDPDLITVMFLPPTTKSEEDNSLKENVLNCLKGIN